MTPEEFIEHHFPGLEKNPLHIPIAAISKGYAKHYYSENMKESMKYVNEIKERIIFELASEFGDHDRIKKSVESHFENIESRLLTTECDHNFIPLQVTGHLHCTKCNEVRD